jgi:hypothetical protein
MSPAKIRINGREYDTPEAMPPDVRKLYEDAMRQVGPSLADQDGNGIPDIFEGKGSGRAGTFISNRITVNNKTYASVDELPPDVRKLYDEAMSRAGGSPVVKKSEIHFSFGISPGARKTPGSAATFAATFASSDAPPVAPSPPSASPIEPIGAQSRVQAVLVLLACAIAVGFALWAFRPH